MNVPHPSPIAPEEKLWTGRPSTRLLLGKILRFVIVVGALVGAGVVAHRLVLRSGGPIRHYYDTHQTGIFRAYAAVVSLAGIYLLGRFLAALARLKTTLYSVTTQRLIIESGLVARSLEEVDMRSIEDTQYTQSILARILGVGVILVVSSDKTAPRLELIGIRDPRTVRELIRAHAFEASQRQLFTRST